MRPVHAVTQNRFGKRGIRLFRIATIRLLHLPRQVDWLRRSLHLPHNTALDPLLPGAKGGGVSIISTGQPKSFRRALPHLPLDPDHLTYFSTRTKERPTQEYVAVLERGSIWGYIHGAVFTSADQFVPTFTRDPWGPHLHQVWTCLRLPAPRRISGRALYLVTPEATDNYHHWMIDLLPRIGLVQRAGFSLSSFDHIILNHADRRYQWETLEALGIRKEQVIQINPSLRIQPDQLVVPSLKPSNEQMPAEHVQFLRQHFLKGATARPNRRLFLSRKDAPSRKLKNEDEVFALLRSHGFESVSLTGLSVVEQAHLFSQAEAIAGPSGAAFANLVFAPSGARVIEFASSSWLTVYHWMISARRGLHHTTLLGPGGPPPRELNISGRSADLEVELEKLSRFLASTTLHGAFRTRVELKSREKTNAVPPLASALR